MLDDLGPERIAHTTITTDALLTQRALADHLIGHHAHYLFTVKGNQPGLLAALQLAFADRGTAMFSEPPVLQHGRIEARAIWTTTALNDYLSHELDFPGVGQAFVIERRRTHKKTGKTSIELAYGITSHTPASADARRLLALNRSHWVIENSCHWVLDNHWNEDRCTIRSGHGPDNVTCLRRFAIGVIRSHSNDGIASALRRLSRRPRLALDYLCMTGNSQRRATRAGVTEVRRTN